MPKRIVVLFIIAFLFGSGRASPQNFVYGSSITSQIDGVELSTIKGPLANLYPWKYDFKQTITHPVPSLWTRDQYQTYGQMLEQERQLNAYGFGADILEYNPNPDYDDHNYWLSTHFTRCNDPQSTLRPFGLLYEHINGTRYVPPNGDIPHKDINLEHNRRVFREDIEFMFDNVILPCQSHYITINNRAVIYLWSPIQMEGDFASLLEEMKLKYPIFFIGSINIMSISADSSAWTNLRALDGFMEYSPYVSGMTYDQMVDTYIDKSRQIHNLIGPEEGFEKVTGKHYVLIPTLLFAFDDSKVIPRRNNSPMYPLMEKQVQRYADLLRCGMGENPLDSRNCRSQKIFDFPNIVFLVYNELFEGSAVIESRCDLAPVQRSRWTGCGTDRLEIVRKYFGSR